MSTRAEVYASLDSERDYQDKTHPDKKEVGSFLSVMNVYLRKAEDALASKFEDEAMEMIRKVAATGVRCMEEHGAIARVSSEATVETPAKVEEPAQQVEGELNIEEDAEGHVTVNL